MKKIIFTIVAFILLINNFVYAEKFKIITNMSGLRCAGDFSKFIETRVFCDDSVYKVYIGSVFERVDDNTYTINNEKYILVVFTKTTQTGNGYVVIQKAYYMPEDKNQNGYVQFQSGFDYGLLTLPFKLRFNPSSIYPNATIGPYGGYKIALGYHWTVSFIGTFGLSGVSLNDVNSKEVENVLGFTYAGGAIFSYKNKFQIGFVGGADFIGGEKGKNWTYENKPWIALATGFTFLN